MKNANGLLALAMRSSLGLGLTLSLSVSTFAQQTKSNTPAKPTVPSRSTASEKPSGTKDSKVLPANSQVPEPIALDEIQGPTMALPDLPLQPFLLQKEHGPFMVMAHTFRGKDATRYALALANELRSEYHLNAYVYNLKIKPGNSNLRGVQPTADDTARSDDTKIPERFRIYDEAAVLVGNCKSIDESEKVLHDVKKIKPVTLDNLPGIWQQRKGWGLKRAFLTTNPLVASQNIYPGKGVIGPGGTLGPGNGELDPFAMTASFEQKKITDPLVKRMNGGPKSVFKCPNGYSLLVAEFSGRSAIKGTDGRFNDDLGLKTSPLMTAHEDAEKLADSLNKCKTMQGKFPVYVYHDRFSSKVYVGSFTNPNQPAVKQLFDAIPAITGELLERKLTSLPLAPGATATPVPRAG